MILNDKLFTIKCYDNNETPTNLKKTSIHPTFFLFIYDHILYRKIKMNINMLKAPLPAETETETARTPAKTTVGKDTSISTSELKEGEEEMTKSIIQERPLPELPIKQYVLPILYYYSIITIFVFRKNKIK